MYKNCRERTYFLHTLNVLFILTVDIADHHHLNLPFVLQFCNTLVSINLYYSTIWSRVYYLLTNIPVSYWTIRSYFTTITNIVSSIGCTIERWQFWKRHFSNNFISEFFSLSQLCTYRIRKKGSPADQQDSDGGRWPTVDRASDQQVKNFQKISSFCPIDRVPFLVRWT